MGVTRLLLLGLFYTIQMQIYVLFCTRLYSQISEDALTETLDAPMQDASPDTIKNAPSDSAKDFSSDAQADVSNQVQCGQNLQILPKKSEIQEPNFPQFLCEICNFEAPNQSFLEMHFTNIQHKRNMLMTQPFYCRVCDVNTDNGSLEEHLNGKKHKKKLEMLDIRSLFVKYVIL